MDSIAKQTVPQIYISVARSESSFSFLLGLVEIQAQVVKSWQSVGLR